MVKKLLLPVLAATAFSVALCFSPAGAAPPAPASDGTLIAEITAQQALLVANQVKIDQSLAEVKEDLRLARLFSARSGGKTSTP